MSSLASVREIEQELAELRLAQTGPDEATTLRTSSMTHLAWVPERWVDVATNTLAGLAERHPARTVLLFPEPDAGRGELVAEVDLRCFVNRGVTRQVCSEVISIRLLGDRAEAPASVVEPLLLPDLPAFLRWRGPLGRKACDVELMGVVDRLVVDSSEWPSLEEEYMRLPGLFERTAVSDIAWARVRPWRTAIADLWPDVREASSLRVAGPEADALLLASWLGARLDRRVELRHEPAGEIELVEVDGDGVELGRQDNRTPSDLLSEQLDIFARDRIYEEAVSRLAPVAA